MTEHLNEKECPCCDRDNPVNGMKYWEFEVFFGKTITIFGPDITKKPANFEELLGKETFFQVHGFLDFIFSPPLQKAVIKISGSAEENGVKTSNYLPAIELGNKKYYVYSVREINSWIGQMCPFLQKAPP